MKTGKDHTSLNGKEAKTHKYYIQWKTNTRPAMGHLPLEDVLSK